MTSSCRRRRLAVLGCALLMGVAACEWPAPGHSHREPAGPFELVYAGRPRAVAPDFLGVSGESINTDLAGLIWQDPGFATTVAELRPGNFRFFGGTSANLWNWRTGRLGTSGPAGTSGYRVGRPSTPIAISQFVDVAKGAGATGVVDLNMTTSTLGDQLDLIGVLKSAGVSVRRVELGNELWAPGYRPYFSDGTAYARVANVWIAAIHKAFPGIEVGVDANNPAKARDKRARTWNRGLFANVQGADAAILHTYLRAPDGPPEEVVTAPKQQWNALVATALATIPQRLPVWVTEWNYAPTASGNQTWSRAIGNALFAVQLLSSPRVGMADFHALIGAVGSTFPAVWATPEGRARDGAFHYRLSPAGAVLQLLFRTVDGCREVQLVRTRAGGTTGVACLTAGKKRVLVVNPTATARVMDVTAVAGSGNPSITRVAQDPESERPPSDRAVREVDDTGSVRVPAWGVIAIEA